MKVLVIFGSKSDITVFKPIMQKLKERKTDAQLNVCSAHRTPDRLADILEEHFDLIISGAGLAAHLPGVIASHTISPVVGVPVESNFEGLDAMLSIAQMPPGIPVLCSGTSVNPADFDFLFSKHEEVNLCGEVSSKRAKSARNMLTELGVRFTEGDYDKDKLNINFFELNGGKPKKEAINVPLLEGSTAKDAKTFLVKNRMGPCVGINRGENAAIFAVMLLNNSGSHTENLVEHRKAMAVKVIESEKEALEDVN